MPEVKPYTEIVLFSFSLNRTGLGISRTVCHMKSIHANCYIMLLSPEGTRQKHSAEQLNPCSTLGNFLVFRERQSESHE